MILATYQSMRSKGKFLAVTCTKLNKERPWNKLCVDIIGPRTLYRKVKKIIILIDFTMINPVTGWSRITKYDDKLAITISNLVENTWLTRYLHPTEITYDQ